MPKNIKQPKVSIIIVNYNGEEFLPNLLESIIKIKYPNYETIIVDNASTDKSLRVIKKYSSKIKVIKNVNNGFAGGANVGIKNCSPDSEYLIALNADMIIHPDWLGIVVKTMLSDDKIAVVGNALLDPKSDTIQMLGHSKVNENLAQFNRIGAGKNLNEFLDKETIQADFCIGLMRKSVLKEVGLFDSKNFLMYEEADLCRRIRDAGYKIVVVPKAKIWHLESQSLKKTTSLRIYYSYKNRLRYVLRHNKRLTKFFYADILILIYFYKILKFSFKGKFNLSLAIARGIWWNIKNFEGYI